MRRDRGLGCVDVGAWCLSGVAGLGLYPSYEDWLVGAGLPRPSPIHQPMARPRHSPARMQSLRQSHSV
ncbi:MAG: hypothetical protein ABI396_15715 [Ktedonobacteraceae bacterium]